MPSLNASDKIPYKNPIHHQEAWMLLLGRARLAQDRDLWRDKTQDLLGQAQHC